MIKYTFTILLFIVSFGCFSQEKFELLNVQLYNLNDDSKLDTTVTVEYLNDSLDVFIFSKFNYPEFKHRLLNDSTLILEQADYKVEIHSRKFDTSNNELSFIENGQILDKINGLKIWGTDGNIPRTVISNVEIKNQKTSKKLEAKYISNLFEPNIKCKSTNCHIKGYLTDKNNLLISMFNSDGAGGYTVLFLFDKDLNLSKRIIGFGF